MTTASKVRERPILFSGPMVRAILDGRKGQTRRVVKPQPDTSEWGSSRAVPYGHWTGADATWSFGDWPDFRGGVRRGWHIEIPGIAQGVWPCPFGEPGDLLWVRETWAYYGGNEYLYQRFPENVMHRATWTEDPRQPVYCTQSEPVGDRRWRPSIHMPKWAARIWLRVTDVSVERLQEITEEDVAAEGASPCSHPECQGEQEFQCGFASLWDGLNAERGYAFLSNPWVWVVSFERAEAPR